METLLNILLSLLFLWNLGKAARLGERSALEETIAKAVESNYAPFIEDTVLFSFTLPKYNTSRGWLMMNDIKASVKNVEVEQLYLPSQKVSVSGGSRGHVEVQLGSAFAEETNVDTGPVAFGLVEAGDLGLLLPQHEDRFNNGLATYCRLMGSHEDIYVKAWPKVIRNDRGMKMGNYMPDVVLVYRLDELRQHMVETGTGALPGESIFLEENEFAAPILVPNHGIEPVAKVDLTPYMKALETTGEPTDDFGEALERHHNPCFSHPQSECKLSDVRIPGRNLKDDNTIKYAALLCYRPWGGSVFNANYRCYAAMTFQLIPHCASMWGRNHPNHPEFSRAKEPMIVARAELHFTQAQNATREEAMGLLEQWLKVFQTPGDRTTFPHRGEGNLLLPPIAVVMRAKVHLHQYFALERIALDGGEPPPLQYGVLLNQVGEDARRKESVKCVLRRFYLQRSKRVAAHCEDNDATNVFIPFHESAFPCSAAALSGNPAYQFCRAAFEHSTRAGDAALKGLAACLNPAFLKDGGILNEQEIIFLNRNCNLDQVSGIMENASKWAKEVVNLVSPSEDGAILRAVKKVGAIGTAVGKDVVWLAKKPFRLIFGGHAAAESGTLEEPGIFGNELKDTITVPINGGSMQVQTTTQDNTELLRSVYATAMEMTTAKNKLRLVNEHTIVLDVRLLERNAPDLKELYIKLQMHGVAIGCGHESRACVKGAALIRVLDRSNDDRRSTRMHFQVPRSKLSYEEYGKLYIELSIVKKRSKTTGYTDEATIGTMPLSELGNIGSEKTFTHGPTKHIGEDFDVRVEVLDDVEDPGRYADVYSASRPWDCGVDAGTLCRMRQDMEQSSVQLRPLGGAVDQIVTFHPIVDGYGSYLLIKALTATFNSVSYHTERGVGLDGILKHGLEQVLDRALSLQNSLWGNGIASYLGNHPTARLFFRLDLRGALTSTERTLIPYITSGVEEIFKGQSAVNELYKAAEVAMSHDSNTLLVSIPYNVQLGTLNRHIGGQLPTLSICFVHKVGGGQADRIIGEPLVWDWPLEHVVSITIPLEVTRSIYTRHSELYYLRIRVNIAERDLLVAGNTVDLGHADIPLDDLLAKTAPPESSETAVFSQRQQMQQQNPECPSVVGIVVHESVVLTVAESFRSDVTPGDPVQPSIKILTAICVKEENEFEGNNITPADMSRFARRRANRAWGQRNRRFLRRGIENLYRLSGGTGGLAQGAMRSNYIVEGKTIYLLSAQTRSANVLNFRVILGGQEATQLGIDYDHDFASQQAAANFNTPARLDLGTDSLAVSIERVQINLVVKLLVENRKPIPNVAISLHLNTQCENIFVGYRARRKCVVEDRARPTNKVTHGECTDEMENPGLWQYFFEPLPVCGEDEEVSEGCTTRPVCRILFQDLYITNMRILPQSLINKFAVSDQALEEWVETDYLNSLIMPLLVIDPEDVESPLTPHGEDLAHWLYDDGEAATAARVPPALMVAFTAMNIEMTAEQRYEIPVLFKAINEYARYMGIDVVDDADLDDLMRKARDQVSASAASGETVAEGIADALQTHDVTRRRPVPTGVLVNGDDLEEHDRLGLGVRHWDSMTRFDSLSSFFSLDE